MNIHVFGCSFSNDLYGWSWPRELAKMLPDYKIYNYSMPGSDVLWSLYCMDQVEKTNDDFLIFQSTTSCRVTTWSVDFKVSDYFTQDNNYFYLDKHEMTKLFNFTYCSPASIESNVAKFKKSYYKHMPYEIMRFQHKVNIERGVAKCDYSFSQKNKEDGLVTLMEEWGKKKYRKHVFDGAGMHLSHEGCKLQAQWVANKIGMQ